MRSLAPSHRVIAPDLRGIGGTSRPEDGYDLHTPADDGAAMLDALGVKRAAVVGIDAGAPVAWMLARRHADRVTHLVVMEGLLGRLPGAERFLTNGSPWWFGFHGATGLAETVLEGHDAEYLDFFYKSGTHGGAGIAPEARDAFVAAYRGRDALRGGFAHYRSLAANGEQIARAAEGPLSSVPTLALGGNVVGDALHRQLEPITQHLGGELLDDCGHIIPEDKPEELAALIGAFVGSRAA
jgi:pimeloyl-ACP methyl ester carboxylesterase